MLFVRREFAPAMPMQQVVDRRQGHTAAKGSFQFGLDLRHHQDAPFASACQKRGQNFTLTVNTQVLPPSTAGMLALAIANRLAG